MTRVRVIIWICSLLPTRMLKEIIVGLRDVRTDPDRDATSKDLHDQDKSPVR